MTSTQTPRCSTDKYEVQVAARCAAKLTAAVVRAVCALSAARDGVRGWVGLDFTRYRLILAAAGRQSGGRTAELVNARYQASRRAQTFTVIRYAHGQYVKGGGTREMGSARRASGSTVGGRLSPLRYLGPSAPRALAQQLTQRLVARHAPAESCGPAPQPREWYMHFGNIGAWKCTG